MKKILFLTNNWRQDYGGRRIVSAKIINYLSSSGFDITVANFEMKAGQKDYDFQNNVHVQTYFIKKNSELIPHLKDMSKKSHYDLIICSGAPHFDIMAVLTIKLLSLFKNSKTILFAHVHPLKSIKVFSLSAKDISYNFGYYVFSHVFYRLFDKIVTPSHALKMFFVRHFFIKQESVIIINNPIIGKDIVSNNMRRVNNKEKVLITIARLNIFQKDFQTLFQALKEINKKINCKLIILGEGEDKKTVVRLAKKQGVYDQVKMLGFIKNPINYIKRSDVFVLSSFYEGFPGALIEAMAGKIPIVATDCDFGPKEILENGKNGILVPAGDLQALAQAVLKLFEDNKLRNKFIKNGLKIIKKYDEARSFRSWNNFINKVI